MSDRLLLRLHADGSLAWLAQDAQGRPLSGANAGVPPAETLTRVRRILVLVPAEQVLLLDTPRMSAQRAQFAKALPFALEDQLASPVEELHFALPERLNESRVPVAIVERNILRRWLERLARDGIRPDALIPETLALPPGCVVIEPDRALLRTAPAQAGACDLAALPDWLDLFAANAGEPVALDVLDFRSAPALSLPVAIAHYHERQRDPLAFFAAQLHAEPALNLLQGQFAPAHRHAPALRLWRNAAVLAAAAVLLLFVYYGVDCWRLASESARLDTAMRGVLHEGFPEMDNVAGDPRQLMDSALMRMRGGADAGGLLRVLNQIAPTLGSTTRMTLRSVEYHNATLELGLRAPDVPALDLMRERLANLPGLKVEVTAATSADNGIDGRLRIVAGAKP
ncbi:MAG: type II secretion system protein GspL [Rudaea sp.]|nr:type II secretion system protein GspL [Rudaea sp.]